LKRANAAFRPSKPTTVKKKKGPPATPLMSDLPKAAELYAILRPVGDATDQLQADGPTSNTVMLSIVSSFRRKLFDLKIVISFTKKSFFMDFRATAASNSKF